MSLSTITSPPILPYSTLYVESINTNSFTTGSLIVNGNETINGNLTTTGTSTMGGLTTINANEVINGNLTVSGTSIHGGLTTINANEVINGNLTVSGTINGTGAGSNAYIILALSPTFTRNTFTSISGSWATVINKGLTFASNTISGLTANKLYQIQLIIEVNDSLSTATGLAFSGLLDDSSRTILGSSGLVGTQSGSSIAINIAANTSYYNFSSSTIAISGLGVLYTSPGSGTLGSTMYLVMYQL